MGVLNVFVNRHFKTSRPRHVYKTLIMIYWRLHLIICATSFEAVLVGATLNDISNDTFYVNKNVDNYHNKILWHWYNNEK